MAAIRIEGLSKQYRIGRARAPYLTLRETIMELASAPWRWLRRRHGGAAEQIWALKDVSLEVEAGEVVGIVGRNGAGKSTLLKILSRITEPTRGRVELRGRVGSLLEVGTGFHPELTGRENIYLNGALLGMRRLEIRRKFDEIVAFAGIEPFLDTPVKRYSSGMYVRLAFAVAAHLEPDILLVDEVLAVGDAAFQRKCLGRMEQIRYEGRTILFVSHNLAAVSMLCARSIWLADGSIAAAGPTAEVVRAYLASVQGDDEHGSRDLTKALRTQGDQLIRFVGVELRDGDGNVTSQFPLAAPITIVLTLESQLACAGEVGYTVKTIEGLSLFTSSSNDDGRTLDIRPGRFQIETVMDPNHLRPGRYVLQVGTTCVTCRDLVPEAITFEVLADRHYSKGQLYHLPGHLFFPYRWGEVAYENGERRQGDKVTR